MDKILSKRRRHFAQCFPLWHHAISEKKSKHNDVTGLVEWLCGTKDMGKKGARANRAI